MKIRSPSHPNLEYTTCDLCGKAFCHPSCHNLVYNDDCFHRCVISCEKHHFRRELMEITQDTKGLLQVIFAENCIKCELFNRFVMVNMLEVSFELLDFLDDIYHIESSRMNYSVALNQFFKSIRNGIDLSQVELRGN